MAKAIMIQGTMSNAGKSLLAAGLCRIFTQDGYKVAPFKSQNMALNSFITEEGLEMGRAQVMQAECCGVAPSVLMNPILLKPTNDVGSQVIVNGEVMGNMSARDYFAYKKKLIPDIMKAYQQLSDEYDIIVIEGAGSPAEINLKQDDIVNMGMAKLAKAPVLLVGDIDRGGVFAQLVGTVMLLEEDEQQMVKGLIINKFRGDKTILDPGIEMLEERCKIPVVGVAPYMHIEVEDEDSLTERFSRHSEVGLIDLAVIRLPRISNFTDFNPFETMPGVSLRYVSHVSELKNPDVIFLPGTKNTMEDLRWLRQCGMEAAVLKHAAAGKVVFGICGGYQMLGEILRDPNGVESGGSMRGIGLLPMDTVFEDGKTRTRVRGTFRQIGGVLGTLSGVDFEGYEIHMGTSTLHDPNASMTEIEVKSQTVKTVSDNYENKGGSPCGSDEDGTECSSPCGRNENGAECSSQCKQDGTWSGNIYGTYIHGIFDKAAAAKTFIEAIGAQKGISTENMTGMDFQQFKETQYDILAEELRKSLDMKEIYRILEAGISSSR